MNEDQIETHITLSKKDRILKFYERNKILIFLGILFFIITTASISFYFESKEKKKLFWSNNYIEARIYLERGEKSKAKDILKTIIFANDKTYSVMSLFLILKENLVVDQQELTNLFDHILENNKFDKEVENLIIFKKSLFQSNFVDESKLLESLKPLISKETFWKPHALLLLGDYFSSKNEYLKAKEFYIQVLSLKSLNIELYEHANSQLAFIAND